MKKKYSAYFRAADNVGTSVIITGALLVLKIIQRQPEITTEEIRSLTQIYFSSTLFLIAAITGFCQTMNWYFINDTVRVSMGTTRKKIFAEMQITKLLSSAVIYAIILKVTGSDLKNQDMRWIFWSFAFLMIFQSMSEFAFLLWFRFRKAGTWIMAAVSAPLGFLIGYLAIAQIKDGMPGIHLDLALLSAHPVGGTALCLLVCLTLIGSGWQLWKKTEIAL